MENPEEILHSLEEFAKMKPKDIPRELEEYLKFVAKTGDPVYQWSVIKSLFREKLINVITEFYESCTSMEIPPCPNVEMFNYDLMKNFILEKLDTFGSAPFTLQRICELLTSPKKEYSRIDKYMRALEKNILVVSTMEPGGRRSENGDGVMNGIESDHELVPEPGNEINVEEMDDSPSWPQNIQTNNHISEPISFENPENEYHVSTSSQEIVCVQYVSVEPLASEGLPIQSEDVKESDISVTITAVNVEKGDENQAEILTPEAETQPAMDPKETTEMAHEPEILKTEAEAKIDLHSIEPIENALKDSSKYIADSASSDPLTEDILPTTTSDKPSQEPNEVQAISIESETTDIKNVSPETSVTSSENSPSQSSASVDARSEDLSLENTSNSVEALEASKENQEVVETKQILETDSPGEVDSTTKESGDDHIIIEDVKMSASIDCEETSEVALPEVDPEEKPLDSPIVANEISSVCEDGLESETAKQPDEIPKVETLIEVLAQQEEPKHEKAAEAKVILEEILKSDELPESKSELPVELTPDKIPLIPEEKEIPMEVDMVPEEPSDSHDKDKPKVEEPETSEPPV